MDYFWGTIKYPLPIFVKFGSSDYLHNQLNVLKYHKDIAYESKLNQPRYFRKENALIKCVIRKFFLFQRRNNLVENRKINWGKIVTHAEDRLENANLPEAMAHWYSIKKEYPENFLIAYRMGDFYEFFMMMR